MAKSASAAATRHSDPDAVERRRGRAGQVLDPADHHRADDAAELAERVDQRDAARRAGAGHELGRQRPERRDRRDDAGAHQRQGEHQRHGLLVEQAGGEEAERRRDGRPATNFGRSPEASDRRPTTTMLIAPQM